MGRQKWRVLGRVHNSNAEVMSMLSHAAVPYAEDIGGGFFRVYFSSRDKDNRSFTHSLIFDIENPIKILELDVNPVLAPGVFGSFDADGAMSSWITQSEDERYLYYVGWNNQSEKKIFRNAIGLAISKNNGPFEKISSGPILDRSIFDSGFTASCSVLKVENEWRMWYLSCIGWEFVQGRAVHRYHIKEAKSSDGINWMRRGVVAINFRDETEYAISRPSVIYDGVKWKMWYSYRGASYKIGYAESQDGSEWIRLDDQIIPEDFNTEWSNEMFEYPHVFRHHENSYMLYNGNGYGRSGFGIAVMEGS